MLINDGITACSFILVCVTNLASHMKRLGGFCVLTADVCFRYEGVVNLWISLPSNESMAIVTRTACEW